MSRFPAVFISHGSPDLLLRESPAREFLQQLGTQLGKPNAILVVSAHWLTPIPTVSAAAQASTIHDFGGFSPELYQMKYPAPGAPKLAEQTIKLLAQAGFETETDPSRGLDHGAWEPLLLMYPQADIPVTQLSIQPRLGTSHHLQLGRALAPLQQEDVLILASGSTTHNLRAFGAYPFDAPPPDWVKQFDEWLKASIAANDIGSLLDYRRQTPYATQNHPSDEHLLPLFVALGAGGRAAKGTQLHTSFTYGVLSMAAYAFN
ncbi:dioxygenase [Phormidium tenue FACHB-886]|nr:dioxygenase [Phormidium tenue FACHB-886]